MPALHTLAVDCTIPPLTQSDIEMIRELDEGIARVLQALDGGGLADDTLVRKAIDEVK